MKSNNEKSVERQIAESDFINSLKKFGAEDFGADFLALDDDEQLAVTTTMGLANVLNFDKADFHITGLALSHLLKSDKTHAALLCIAINENVKKILLKKLKDIINENKSEERPDM